jgi:Putative beta-barrel porin-2, OmpL-like. bbp2
MIRVLRLTVAVAVAVTVTVTVTAAAQEGARPEIVAPAPLPPPPPAPVSHWYDEVAIHGFVSFAANVNFDNPRPLVGETFSRNEYRAFDYIANTFSLDVAELTVERAPTSPHDVGVRIDIATGETIPRVAAANGSSAGPFDLQQAYLYYVMENGLRLDLGKFVTPAGIEVIEGYDGYNDLYSHSFSFLYGPFTHTGVKLSYAMKTLTIAAYLVNGWDVLIDNNTDPSFIGQVVFTPIPEATLQVIYIGGKELPNPDPPWRHYLEVCLTLKPTSTMSVLGHFNFAKEGDTSWYGGVGYLTWAPPGDYSLAFRGEVFADPDGVKTGLPGGQTLTELTATGSYKFGVHHVARLELRWDHSSEDAFPTHDGVSSSQVTIAANYLGMF